MIMYNCLTDYCFHAASCSVVVICRPNGSVCRSRFIALHSAGRSVDSHAMQNNSAVGCRGCLDTREEQGSVLPTLKWSVIGSKETLYNCIIAVTSVIRQQAAPTSQ